MPKILLIRLVPFLFLLLVSACDYQQKELRFHILNHENVNNVAIQEIFSQQAGIGVTLVNGQPGQSALNALQSGDTDLALVNRTRPFTSGVRAIMPVYKSVLHLLVPDEQVSQADARSLAGKRIHIVNNSLAGRRLLEVLAERQDLSPGDYELLDEYQPGTTDLIIYLGPIDPDNQFWKKSGFRLVNAAEDPEGGTLLTRTGLSYLVPGMDLMEIPARTYPIAGNEEDVLTLSVDTLLVTRKDVPVDLIYPLSKTLFEHKPRFMAVAPTLFSAVNTNFDQMDLNFPLHPGARAYLERNEPSFLERYAETINMLTYVVFLLISGFLAMARWNAHRKKDRIDTFYTRVFAIRKQAQPGNCRELKKQLIKLEEEAFASLVSEKLAANESFRIFTDLLARTHSEIDKTGENPSDVGGIPS
ncbi:MAG: ABC transporter substrate-binding protein [Xanthomonadales bacterium]|nr:ABC transporter substrate-binding protein [Xanthomonadales bacterium]